MAILITGGAGFIGSHLIQRLMETSTAQLVCVDNFSGSYCRNFRHQIASSFARSPRFQVVEADVRDTQAMSALFDRWSIRRVIHLAALAGVRDSRARPLEYQEHNVGGTLSLLETCRTRTVEQFVFVSSSTVYGVDAVQPFQEDQALGIPASPYGVTKRAAELMVMNYHHLYALPAVILRPFSVYGSRMRPDLAISLFAEKMQSSEPLTLYGDGSARRDYTHVSDICSGIVAALWSDQVVGEAINLGSGRPLRMDYVIEQLAHGLGTTPRIMRAPSCAADLPVTHASIAKARDLLGYEPQVAFEDGILEYVSWFRQRQFPRLVEETLHVTPTTPRFGTLTRVQAS